MGRPKKPIYERQVVKEIQAMYDFDPSSHEDVEEVE